MSTGRFVGIQSLPISMLTTKRSSCRIYIMPLTIGDPPMSYPLQIDLASSDILLATTQCTDAGCPSVDSEYVEENFYDMPGSVSFVSVNNGSEPFNLTFSDGSFLAGVLGKERMALPVSSTGLAQDIVLGDQVFGMVNETNVDFDTEGIVGILGLGFPRLSQFARIGLRNGSAMSVITTVSASSSISSTTSSSSAVVSTSTSAVNPSTSTATSSSSGGAFFSILPVGNISTAISQPTGSLSKRAPKEDIEYYPPFLESLFSSNTTDSSNTTSALSYPVFGLALSNSSEPYSARTASASITFGGVSSNFVLPANETNVGSGRTVDDIEWHDVVPYGLANGAEAPGSDNGMSLGDLEGENYLFWTIQLNAVTMNGTAVDLVPTYNSSFTGLSGSTALLDVGTNGIFAPQQDVIELFSHIPESRQVAPGQWAAPCDTRQTMTFAFGEGGRVIELQPSEWMYARITGSSMCLAWPVVGAPNSDADWQLGTPFLRKVYTIFGYGINGLQAPVVGFLPLPSLASPSPTNTTANSTTTSASTRIPTDPTPTYIQNASQVASLVTVTIATVLPNVLLPDPTYSTPAYLFNTSAQIPTLGALQSEGLADASAFSVGPVPVITSVVQTASAPNVTASVPRTTRVSTGSNASNSNAGAIIHPSGVYIPMILLFVAYLICDTSM